MLLPDNPPAKSNDTDDPDGVIEVGNTIAPPAVASLSTTI